MSDALNTQSQITTVGPQLSTFYNVPFEFELQIGWSTRSAEYFPIAGGWQPLMDAGVVTNGTPSSFAVFTLLPEPGAALSLAAALATLGVVGRRKQASKRTA